MTPANWSGSPIIAMVISSSSKLKLAQDSGTKCGGSRAQLSPPAHTVVLIVRTAALSNTSFSAVPGRGQRGQAASSLLLNPL